METEVAVGIGGTVKYGLDYLGGKNYERAMLRIHPRGMVGGIFLNTFGYAITTVAAMCASKRFSEIVIHITPFDYSHMYPVAKTIGYIQQQAKLLEAIAVKYPETVLMLSPYCEHNHSASTIKPVLETVRRLAPSCLVVNAILKGQHVPGFITEFHLPNSRNITPPPGEYTVSFDGFGGDGSGNSSDSDVAMLLKRYRRARHIRMWAFRFNGKFGFKDTSPITSRKHWPDEKYIRAYAGMMKTREGVVTFDNTMLYKPMGDDHGAPSPTKDNKALLIIPVSDTHAEVLTKNGKVIDTMLRFEPDYSATPKGARYYSKLYCHEIARLAKESAGSTLVAFRVGKKVTPYTDANLRSNFFK